MSGNKIGGLKTSKEIKKLYGADFYKRIGALGGAKKGVAKGFAKNPELASRVGRIGGLTSRRTKKENKIES